MKLLTEAIKKKMPGPRAQENVDDPVVHVKYFHPFSSIRWYATEAWQCINTPDGGYREAPLSEPLKPGEECEDITFFGWVDGDYPEMGPFSLNEMEATRVNGLPMERDRHFKPQPLSKVQK